MGKILPKRKYFKSTIYRPNLDVGSHIDNVKYSLEHLIFSNAKETESNLLKKRIKIVASITVLLMVVSSFFSPKGKAEIATFYPTACLGGWNNPHHAEGEPQVISNSNESDFDGTNSALLHASTSADIYCGNFVGSIEKNTKPVKMLVSFSWSKNSDTALVKNISEEVSSSTDMGNVASTTDISLELSTTTQEISTSTDAILTGSSTASTTQEIDIATTTDIEKKIDGVSLVNKVIDAVSSAFSSLFSNNNDSKVNTSTTTEVGSSTDQVISNTENIATTTIQIEDVKASTTEINIQNESSVETSSQKTDAVEEQTVSRDTVPVQEITPTPTPVIQEASVEPSQEQAPEPAPVSLFNSLIEKISTAFVKKVFAEEIIDVTEKNTPEDLSSVETINTNEASLTSEEMKDASLLIPEIDNSSSTLQESTSTDDSTFSTSTKEIAELFQNDFLEVLYTFDGITWFSLGKVSEQSMKYRTFEIPVTASTSWEDMSKLQLKVASIERMVANPAVYLDGIKVEVLYESTMTHEHPDFVRDTILQDELVGNIRIIRIINNDTNLEEIWYLHQESVSTTTVETVATSTDSNATSTHNATSTEVIPETSQIMDNASSTNTQNTNIDGIATTSGRVIRPNSLKNTWVKLDVEDVSSKDITEIVKDIEIEEEKQEFIIPDFTKDFIKKIQGSFLHAVVVQIEQEGKDSLWLFDIEKNTEEKIDSSGKATFSKTYPFGMKDETVFWLSEDKTIVFSYNVITKVIDQKEIPPYDISLGERGVVFFDTIPWKVIVGSDQFSFFSEETGEVFSDDNLNVGEAFRIKEKLDTILKKEDLENLNFVTDTITDTVTEE